MIANGICNVVGYYQRLWCHPIEKRGKRHMPLQADVDNKVTVIIKTASRDEKTGRISYETFESFNVVDETPQQVAAKCKSPWMKKLA